MIALPAKLDFARYSKEDQQKIIGLLAAAAGIVVVSYMFLFSGGWKQIGKTYSDVGKWKTKVQEASRTLKEKDKTLKDAQTVRERVKMLSQWIPEEVDTSWILKLVGDVESSQKTRTVAIKPLNSKEVEKEFNEMQMKEDGAFKLAVCQVEMKTDYHSLGKFIDLMERKNPVLKIGNMAITSAGDGSNKHSVIFKIRYLISNAGKLPMPAEVKKSPVAAANGATKKSG